MANNKLFKPFQLFRDRGMDTTARYLDQKDSIKLNAATDKVQDELIETIEVLTQDILDNPNDSVRVGLTACHILDSIKIYQTEEVIDNLSRRQVLEHNGYIGKYSKEITSEAESNINEIATR